MSEGNRSEAHVDDRRGWHFDKVINMPLLIVILAQTGGVVWAGAQLAKTVELQGVQIAAIDLKVNGLVQQQSGNAAITLRIQTSEQEIAGLRVKSERLELELARMAARQDDRRR